MTREPTKRWAIRKSLVLAILVLVVAAGTLGAAACYLGIKTRMDLVAYAAMVHEGFHPLWRDLAFRRIREGDRLDDLVARHTALRRHDFPPYVLLEYEQPFGSLAVVAKNGKLVKAQAGSCTWRHVFFEVLDPNEEFAKAHSAYIQQRLLEIDMYRLHRAIANGQTVFLARATGAFPVSADVWVRGNAIQERPEFEVEVTRAVCGAIERGTKLQVSTAQLRRDDLSELEPVFVHVEDSRILFPHSPGGELYATVSRSALDRYLSLSAEEVRETEARCLAHSPALATCLRLRQNEAESQPTSAGDSSPREAEGLGTPEK